MLTTLRIRNLALVADVTLELDPGYTVLTGETGAGKSILIGALGLLLGGRADRTLLRAGEDSCAVEAVFDVRHALTDWTVFLEEAGLEPPADGQLVIRRVFTAAGANRQFVNGSPTSLQVLGRIGDRLVDLHGPHDHQSLLRPAHQLEMLDAYADLSGTREGFSLLIRKRRSLLEQKAALIVDESEYEHRLDLLRHQVREITDARLSAEEEEELTREHRRVSNSARLLELGQAARAVLSEDDLSLTSLIGSLGRTLNELVRLDPEAERWVGLQEQAVSQLQELQNELTHYLDRLELDPGQLQALDDRLNLLHALKRKYGPTLADVIAFGARAANELGELEGREEVLTRLNAELDQLEARVRTAARELSDRRGKAIPGFVKEVEKHLADLGFRQSRFGVELVTDDPSGADWPPTGFDRVEFLFAPNPGEPARPLRAIASSGELARVMLALKTVLAAQDDIPVLVFDEVDANIGGETAHAVGRKMRDIGKRRQVLCITHLAPVAAAASAHQLIEKEVRGGRSITGLKRVSGAERILELARMLGGKGEVERRHAEALLQSQPT